ncbi:MAG: VCBS repeat-containing protein [Candidatus Kapabacteria bacterium]|nr:VCBS repeat-containing protein [Candidatus Kapabacteria bacterium]
MRRVFLVGGALTALLCGMLSLAAHVEDDGKKLADRYCQTCHVKPLPEHLDRSTWLTKVFPMMRQYIGLDQNPSRELMPHDLQAMYPSVPTMTEDEWFAVANWYIDNAPEELPSTPMPKVTGPSTVFEATPVFCDDACMPMTILARFDALSRRFITADAMSGSMNVYSSAGKILTTIAIGGPVSSIAIRGSTWYVTDMGKLLPHDSAVGAVVAVQWKGDTYTVNRIIDSLRRPTHISVEDFNGDGSDDLLVCEFGNLLGRLGWFERRGKRWLYHELVAQPGAIRTEIRDVNGDGRKDIVVLMAQAREGIFVHINKGKGRFESREIITFPPSYGSSSFSFADVDRDGKDDLLVTAGDNGDYLMPPYKPYHGSYVFRLDKLGRVTDTTFRPFDGAYGAIVRDFDLDGLQDMLSYSYFPRLERGDFDLLRLETAAFTPAVTMWSLPMADRGRWLVSDAADVDGDGDIDVLLGNESIGPGRITEEQSAGWRQGRMSALLLINKTR